MDIQDDTSTSDYEDTKSQEEKKQEEEEEEEQEEGNPKIAETQLTDSYPQPGQQHQLEVTVTPKETQGRPGLRRWTSLTMDKGNKDILFQNILFEISFLVLYIRVTRKKDNTRNVIYIQMILIRLQCYLCNHKRYVFCCFWGGFWCARTVLTMVVTLGRERKTVLIMKYILSNYEGS